MVIADASSRGFKTQRQTMETYERQVKIAKVLSFRLMVTLMNMTSLYQQQTERQSSLLSSTYEGITQELKQTTVEYIPDGQTTDCYLLYVPMYIVQLNLNIFQITLKIRFSLDLPNMSHMLTFTHD